MSRDSVSYLHKIARVAERTTTPAKYKAAFCQRIAAARDSAGFTQETMGQALRIGRDRYAKYETRSIMPHHLLAEFCNLTGHHPWYILTGQAPTKSPGTNPEQTRAA